MAQRLILQTVITSAIDLIPGAGGAMKLVHSYGPQGAKHEINFSKDQVLALAKALNGYAEAVSA